MKPHWVAAQQALIITTYIKDEGFDEKVAQDLILEAVNKVGPTGTIVGLSNVILILAQLREEEVGIPLETTLQKLALSLAKEND